MNSASILLTAPPASPATSAASVATSSATAVSTGAPTGDFNQAMAAAKTSAAPAVEEAGGGDAQAASASQTLADGLASAIAALVPGAAPAAGAPATERTTGDADAADSDTDLLESQESGVAAILAQLLAGTSAAAANESSASGDSSPQQDDLPGAEAVLRPNAAATGTPVASLADDRPVSGTDSVKVTAEPQKPADSALDIATAASLASESQNSPSATTQPSTSTSAPGAAQAAVQAAASALRDATPMAAAAPPVHAALREPVGSARWADELGNRLVLMSVRGQQQGSLTLTPEHLGPVEVQISVNRDTANVWFGAQQAETRAALVDAMPRLRELLASSGLSLGQSGVSEQAPREAFVPPPVQGASGATLADSASVQEVTPAWRVWRPGLLDTYA